MKEAKNFRVSDFSIPEGKRLPTKNDDELKARLRQHIVRCNCIIILSGMYVDYSDWIDFEIDTAVDLGKPIIGLEPRGQERVPLKVQNVANVMIGWTSSSVINAVRTYSL